MHFFLFKKKEKKKRRCSNERGEEKQRGVSYEIKNMYMYDICTCVLSISGLLF